MKYLLIVLIFAAVAWGKHVSRENSRIVSGTLATHGQFPYHVGLYYKTYFCSGSLISPRWILTTARNAQPYSSVTVHLGAQNIDNVNTESGRVVIETTQIIIHYDFNSTLYANDIALINMGMDVAITKFVQVISLASTDDLYVNVAARVSGWGGSKTNGELSPELQYAEMQTISNEACKQKINQTYIHDSIICAKGNTNGEICTGDQGGALIEVSSGKQIGIALFWTKAGCDSTDPNAFTRVSSFAPWISSNTGIIL